MSGKSKKKKKGKGDMAPRIENRKARQNYGILEKLEVGIVLTGSEVKAIRNSQISLGEGFAQVDGNTMELYLYQVHINEYAYASRVNGHEVVRPRKLLAHKKQIKKLFGATTTKGTTLVPLCLYFKDGRVKLEIGVCVGKRSYDKRDDVKKREADRDMRRAMTKKVL